MDAIDQVLDLKLGEKFVLRGRTYSRSAYGSTTHYEGRMVLPVWNERGREVRITVKATDKVVLA